MKVQKKIVIGLIRTKLNLLTLCNKRIAGKEAFRLFCTPLSRYTGPEALIFKNGEPLQFEMNSMKIRGYRCNKAADKKVLLLHGFSSSCHKFDHYAAALIQKNYQVLAFDAAAHGASDGTTVNAVEYSDMIKKIITLYGPVDAFVAHSFGGIAICLALETIPHNAATKLVLIAPATETSSAVEGAFQMLGINKKQVQQTLHDHIFTVSGKPTEWYSIRRAIKNIGASILWVHDEDDTITPICDALKVKEDDNPNVQFLFTKGLGHQKIYRDAAVKKSILNFL